MMFPIVAVLCADSEDACNLLENIPEIKQEFDIISKIGEGM